MSPRRLTLVLTFLTTLIWGMWILSTGLTENIAFAGWMADRSVVKPGFAPIVPVGFFLGFVALAWISERRIIAYGIPLFPIVGIILFFLRFIQGMSNFGA